MAWNDPEIGAVWEIENPILSVRDQSNPLVENIQNHLKPSIRQIDEMRLLITGGAGFIGSNYVKQTLSQGNEVVVYDALTYAGNLDNLKEIEENDAYKFIHGDVCDLEN